MPLTLVFSSYQEFLNRHDKDVNGVSPDHAKHNKNYAVANATNVGCWNCARCTRCLDCRECVACIDCIECCSCHNCYMCRLCSMSTTLSDCYNCSYCDALTGGSGAEDCFRSRNACIPPVPVVEGIHQKIYAQVANSEGLAMYQFHTCETSHCWAGWGIHLAGKAGYNLEQATSPSFAAIQIFKKSSPIKVSVGCFYVTAEEAFDLIKKAAEEEQALLQPV